LKRWLGLSGLVFAGVAGAADDAALRIVEACRARLDARTDVGLERIQQRCPDLMPALLNAPWSDLLPRSMTERRDEISATSLGALIELVQHANDVTPRVVLERKDLDPVLASLGSAGDEGASRWDRFKRWLKRKLEGRKDDRKPGWLDEWSRQFRTSEGVAKAITYLGYALVGALMLYVLWSELAAAGLLGGLRRASQRTNPAAEWRRRLILADVMAAPLADRPGMLLKLLGEALTRANRLPGADGLTAGAIVRRAQLDDDADRAALASVASTADEIRYASRKPPDERLEHTVESAKSLLARFARLAGVRR
jgi:hypothetical protein